MFFDFLNNLFQPLMSNPASQPVQPQPDINAFVSLFSGDPDGGASWMVNAAREPPPWAPWAPGYESTPPGEREQASIEYNLKYGIAMPYYTPTPPALKVSEPTVPEKVAQPPDADFPEDATETPPPYAEPDFPEDATDPPEAHRTLRESQLDELEKVRQPLAEAVKSVYNKVNITDLQFEQAPIQRTVGRPRQSPIKGAVIHYTHGKGDGLFHTSNSKRTGYNYYVHPDGKVTMWAPDGIRMGHVGAGRDHPNNKRPDLVNDNTIGIGLVTERDGSGITEKQLQVAQGLVEKKAKEYGFSVNDVFGHGELTSPSHRAGTEGMALVNRLRGKAQQLAAKAKDETLKSRALTFGHPMQLGKGDAPNVKTKISAYSPVTDESDSRIKMEGGVASSRRGPDGKAIVRTVSEFIEGQVPYVTLAGNPKYYGRKYTIKELPVRLNGKDIVLKNVPAVVHDTGSAFKKAPEGRFDLALGIDLDDSTMAVNADIWRKKGLEFIPQKDDE